MVPLLLDEGVPASIAQALRLLDLDVLAIGDDGAPARGSLDHENIAWCAARGAVLVTNDRGKKDKTIFDALAQYRVHALFVYKDLLAGEPHRLARALLEAEDKIGTEVAKKKGLLRHRLRPRGGIDSR